MLLHHPAAVRYARDFAAGRNPHGEFSRLWIVESTFSLTGSAADRRVALPASQIPTYAACLAARLVLDEGVSLPAGAAGLRPVLERARQHELYAEVDDGLAYELAHHRGRSILTAGPRQPAEVHALVHVLNEALGNVGQTVTYTVEPDAQRSSHRQAMLELAADAESGQADTLVILGGNPLYDAPGDVDFAGILDRTGTSIHLSLYQNETSAACTWHLPRAHFLETWGDGRDYRWVCGRAAVTLVGWGFERGCEPRLGLGRAVGFEPGFPIPPATRPPGRGGRHAWPAAHRRPGRCPWRPALPAWHSSMRRG